MNMRSLLPFLALAASACAFHHAAAAPAAGAGRRATRPHRRAPGAVSAPAAAPAMQGPSVRPDVRNSPGYTPLVDPDSMDAIAGRRLHAPLVDKPFRGGAASLEELGDDICYALHTGVPDSLLALCVKSDEFREILWPEFPNSRPVTGLHWDDGWQFLFGHLNGGSVAAVREFGNDRWIFTGLRYASVDEYRNFKLYRNVTIAATSEAGTTREFTFVRSIVERLGRFKVYSLRD